MIINSLEEFNSLITGKLPVVVDFYADWCGPCKMMSPHIEAATIKYKNIVEVVKVNVDTLNEVSAKYDVTSIPTVVFIKGGELIHTSIGAISPSKLNELIEEKFGITAAMMVSTEMKTEATEEPKKKSKKTEATK